MSNSLLTAGLRWVLAVPGGIVAAVLVGFPIHWVLMVNLGGWSSHPVIEVKNPETLRQIELLLQALFGPLAFVYCAARTVPRYNRLVSVLLGGAVVLGVPLVAHWWNAEVIARGDGILIENGLLPGFANVIGSGAAIWMIWRLRATPGCRAWSESLGVIGTRILEFRLMNPSAIRAIRWILVLPAAMAAAFVAQLLVVLATLFSDTRLTDLGVKFIMGAVFVAAGAEVAPTTRPWPRITLLILQVLGAVSGIALTWMDGAANRWWETFLFLTVIFGAAVGYSAARARAKERELEPSTNGRLTNG